MDHRFSGITCAVLNGETTSLKDVQVCCSNQDPPDFMLHAVSTGRLTKAGLQRDHPCRASGFFTSIYLGPDFGSSPSFVRRKLLIVLSKCGKTSSLIDDISIVNRYASGSSHSFPVSSGEEALLKVRKEVMNDGVHFVWTQFSELNSYLKKQVDDEGKLNGKLAEIITLVTCEKKSAHRKGMKYSLTSELKVILTQMDAWGRCLYSTLPTNTMLIICTGHGDKARVHRIRRMLVQQKETAVSLEKIVKVLEELQAQAEVALCFVDVKNRGHAR